MMSRRILMFMAGLVITLAVPASAQAKWLVRLPKKPARIHVIAVRRGHRIIWKVANHGLAKKRLSVVKLSTDLAFDMSAFHMSAYTATAGTQSPVQSYSGNCPPTGTESLPLDGMSFYERYSLGTANAYSDVLTCSGGGYFPPKTAYGPVPLASRTSFVALSGFSNSTPMLRLKSLVAFSGPISPPLLSYWR